jgi:hypothetical protein
LTLVFKIEGATVSLCRQASKKTKMLSAETPSTINTVRVCKLLKYVIRSTPSVITVVKGKLNKIMRMLTVLKNSDLRWKIMYKNTKITENALKLVSRYTMV